VAERTRPIRVFVADDHAVLRAGLKLLLNAETDMVVVGEAADGKETVERAAACAPDVVLLDISMPRLSGLAAARRLKALLPATKIVVLTMHDDEGYLAQFLRAGCSGYVLKKSADTDLTAAIRAVQSGETFVCPAMSRVLIDRYVRADGSSAAGRTRPRQAEELTERERQVVALVAQGYSNKELAEQLFLSVKTIETHKRRIMDKLGFTRQAQLVRHAMDTGILGDAGERAG